MKNSAWEINSILYLFSISCSINSKIYRIILVDWFLKYMQKWEISTLYYFLVNRNTFTEIGDSWNGLIRMKYLFITYN